MRHKGSQDTRDPGRFWSRIDDWQSTPCRRSILPSRSWPLYSFSQFPVLPLSFPIRGCIPPQRFLFHRRRFSSLCLSSAILVTECFLWGSCRAGCGCSRFSHLSLPVILAHATCPAVSRPRDYRRWKKRSYLHCHLVISAPNPGDIIIGRLQRKLWILTIRKEQNGSTNGVVIKALASFFIKWFEFLYSFEFKKGMLDIGISWLSVR